MSIGLSSGLFRKVLSRTTLRAGAWQNLNLGAGTQRIPGYCRVDLDHEPDVHLDLSRDLLPFRSESMESVICMSAINYFTRQRGREIVREVYRVLRPGGVARFGVQDLESIAQRYVAKDREFFFQKLPDGRERFEGPTLGDKFAAWFYGYLTAGGATKYFYDYDSLAHHFQEAGFSLIEKRDFRSSRLPLVELIDNRPDQMFFLEAVK